MGFLGGKQPAPVQVTSSGLATQLQNALETNAERLDARKDQALSSFRSTVQNLRAINQSLQQDVALAEQMIETCTKRRAEAEQQIKDNEAVCSHILQIIGDVKEDNPD